MIDDRFLARIHFSFNHGFPFHLSEFTSALSRGGGWEKNSTARTDWLSTDRSATICWRASGTKIVAISFRHGASCSGLVCPNQLGPTGGLLLAIIGNIIGPIIVYKV